MATLCHRGRLFTETIGDLQSAMSILFLLVPNALLKCGGQPIIQVGLLWILHSIKAGYLGPKIMQDQFRIKFQPLHRIRHRQCLHGVHVRVGPLEWPYKVCTPHSWCLVMRVDLATQPCKSAIKGIPRNPDLEDLFSFFDLGETKVNPFRFCF